MLGGRGTQGGQLLARGYIPAEETDPTREKERETKCLVAHKRKNQFARHCGAREWEATPSGGGEYRAGGSLGVF